MHVQPYLYCDGRCAEALDFYRKVLGAQVLMQMPFKDNPDPSRNPPDSDDKIMHASVCIGDSLLMASDGHCQGQPAFQGFALSVTLATVAEADRIFAALSEGGRIEMPLGETFFSPRFGMVADRFGVTWMVLVTA